MSFRNRIAMRSMEGKNNQSPPSQFDKRQCRVLPRQIKVLDPTEYFIRSGQEVISQVRFMVLDTPSVGDTA